MSAQFKPGDPVWIYPAELDGKPAWAVQHRTEVAEPEGTGDVEPEPLKEGDWVQAWVQVDNPRVNDDGNIMVAIPRVNRFWLMANIQPDAIVRPDAGQVPPWVKPVSAAEALYIEHGWSGCAGSAWENLPSGARKGWEVAAEYAARITKGGAS